MSFFAPVGDGATRTYKNFGTARPSSPSAGDRIIYQNVKYSEEYDGAAWVEYRDPWDLKFFVDRGWLDPTDMPVEIGGEATIPTPDDITLPAAATFTIVSGTGAVVQLGANPGAAGFGWDLSGALSEVLLLIGGVGNPFEVNDQWVFGLQQTQPVTNALDDGYGINPHSTNNLVLFKEDGGSAGLDTAIQTYKPSTSPDDPTPMYAIYFNGSTNRQRVFVRMHGRWFEMCRAADATFATVSSAVLILTDPTINDEAWFNAPVLAFGKA